MVMTYGTFVVVQLLLEPGLLFLVFGQCLGVAGNVLELV